jgi:hypothetical protein
LHANVRIGFLEGFDQVVIDRLLRVLDGEADRDLFAFGSWRLFAIAIAGGQQRERDQHRQKQFLSHRFALISNKQQMLALPQVSAPVGEKLGLAQLALGRRNVKRQPAGGLVSVI